MQTAVVLVVAPDSKWQLWFGLVVSASAALVYLELKPYRHRACGVLQMAVLLQTLFTYISAMVFYAELQESPTGGSSSGGIALIMANSSCLCLVFAFVCINIRSSFDELGWLRIDDARLLPPAGRFHVFLSHNCEPRLGRRREQSSAHGDLRRRAFAHRDLCAGPVWADQEPSAPARTQPANVPW